MKTGTENRGRAPIAITGVGIVSALGIGAEEWLAAVIEGEPAFAAMTGEAAAGISCRGAPVVGYDVAPLLETRKAYLDRHTALLLGAMALALRESGWAGRPLPGVRAGLMVGSAWGGLGTMAAFFRDVLLKGARFAKPILFPNAYANTAAAMTAIEWSIQGPHEHFTGGRLASAQAIGAAVDTLRSGDAEVVFAGGCEALSPALFRALAMQGRLCAEDGGANEKPTGIPFASDGRGVVPGEGAAVLVLETLASARERGAPLLGLLAGVGFSGSGLASACSGALEEAGCAASAIGGVLASGTGFAAEDRQEADALGLVFPGGYVPVTALAGLQGDCQGAAPALDVAGAALLRHAGVLPPVPGLHPPGMSGLRYVLERALPLASDCALMVTSKAAEGSAAFVLR